MAKQSINLTVEPIDLISVQSHRVEDINAAQNRQHMALPYPSNNLDFLAINVPSSYQQGMIPDGEEPPWGMLRVVVTAREKFGFNAGILDAHRLRLQPNQIRRQIINTNAKVIGLNPTSVNVTEAMVIAEICEQLGKPHILGGVHATLDPRIAQNDFPTTSAIVRGNGEYAIQEVLDVILNNACPSLGNGIYYQGQAFDKRKDYAKKLNPELLPMIRQNIYIEQPIYTHTVQMGNVQHEIKEATLFVTDGCPFECTFCSSPIMVNRGRDRPYSRPAMRRIVDEVEHVVTDLGGDAIHFLDDMAFVTSANIRDFHTEIRKRNLQGKFIWRGLTRAPIITRFDQEVMEMMKASGAWKIALGIESGSNQVLKQMKKNVTKEDVIAAVKKLADYNIQVKGFFIMGFPDETEAQIIQTRNFIDHLKDIGLTEMAIFQFKPYPGTVEYQKLLERKPQILKQLTYLRRKHTFLNSKARYRAEQKDVWLPDDLTIAEISSEKVREYVLDALQSFYGKNPKEWTKDPSCS